MIIDEATGRRQLIYAQLDANATTPRATNLMILPGLAQGDTGFDASAVANLSLFPVAIDRLQQGALNTLFLGRLMLNPQGFAANSAFRQGGHSRLETSNLYFDGNSQGGIERAPATV